MLLHDCYNRESACNLQGFRRIRLFECRRFAVSEASSLDINEMVDFCIGRGVCLSSNAYVGIKSRGSIAHEYPELW